jgi:hypothetical protein
MTDEIGEVRSRRSRAIRVPSWHPQQRLLRLASAWSTCAPARRTAGATPPGPPQSGKEEHGRAPLHRPTGSSRRPRRPAQ